MHELSADRYGKTYPLRIIAGGKALEKNADCKPSGALE
jgi:hypothetical protein